MPGRQQAITEMSVIMQPVPRRSGTVLAQAQEEALSHVIGMPYKNVHRTAVYVLNYMMLASAGVALACVFATSARGLHYARRRRAGGRQAVRRKINSSCTRTTICVTL
eukprot:TRINITY_DN17104_c0_g1_i9.p2 TRINITY_DN17104_c0_g1~~TRINITY_DN17104_c0_g1_i9.p2  ORF type:complete len:108 (-),score=1.38 TRINITY_DN17104_c0_g1_i9:1034-1357(-)